MRTTMKLSVSLNDSIKPEAPIISIVGRGRNVYIWVGNDAERNKSCYATKSGNKTLEKFARELLAAVKVKKRKPGKKKKPASTHWTND